MVAKYDLNNDGVVVVIGKKGSARGFEPPKNPLEPSRGVLNMGACALQPAPRGRDAAFVNCALISPQRCHSPLGNKK